MLELVKQVGPILAFMLIPVWIPIIAVVVGSAADAIEGLRARRAVARPSVAVRARRAVSTEPEPAAAS